MGSQPSVQPPVSFFYEAEYRDLVDAVFVKETVARALQAILGDRWVTRTDLDDGLGTTIIEACYGGAKSRERLVEFEHGIAHLILVDDSLTARIAATSSDWAATIRDEIVRAFPEERQSESEVSARFWWSQGGIAEDLGGMITVPPWQTVRGNYVGSAAEQLDSMMGWQRPPAGGRLMLWHGEPGTGKTSALRALAGCWRDWADFQFITDPERFLTSPAYLMSAVAPEQRERRSRDRWRVIVLEDAGEFLAPDAKVAQGQALSRLLNVCDGVLGQMMRALVVVTTNEPLRALHPALSRPGRCLAEVEFERFSREQAVAWAATRSADLPDRRESWSLAELFAFVEDRAHSNSIEPAFGFAAT